MRILIGVRWPLLTKAVSSAIQAAGMEVVGETDSGDNLLEKIGQQKPEMVVISCGLHELSGDVLISQIKETVPAARIMVICEEKSDEGYYSCFIKVIAAGASGCLPISTSEEQFIQALQGIYCGTGAGTSGVLQKVIEKITETGEDTRSSISFSEQELEVLRLASKGMSSKAIAKHISFSERTVHGHFHSIFGKMNVHSRTEAIYKALKNEWISLS